MEIKYLGTGAYEGIPALFCGCAVCREARNLRGRSIRSRLQAIIDDELLLDFPPDTASHSIQYNLDWTKIGDCLITHSHSDHLYVGDVEMAGAGFTGNHRPLHFYASRDGYEKLRDACQRFQVGNGADVSLAEPGKSFTVGERGQYQVTPLRAGHNPETTPVIYSIACDGKRILYAHDTGIFPEDTWELLAAQGRYDLISLDCTGSVCGLPGFEDLDCLGNTMDWRGSHMSLAANLEVAERMRREKMIDENTVIVANHFSHNGGAGYETLRRTAEKYGILAAYDGLEIAL